MPIFIVERSEVWKQAYRVDAETPEEAAKLVEEGSAELLEGEFEFSHNLEIDPESDIHEASQEEADMAAVEDPDAPPQDYYDEEEGNGEEALDEDDGDNGGDDE